MLGLLRCQADKSKWTGQWLIGKAKVTLKCTQSRAVSLDVKVVGPLVEVAGCLSWIRGASKLPWLTVVKHGGRLRAACLDELLFHNADPPTTGRPHP